MAVATAKLGKHYEALGGAERFVAVIEAMARGDEEEERRLEDACPRGTYEMDEPAYRKRMHVSFTAAAIAAASIQRDLDVLRAVAAVREVVTLFRRFMAEGAEDAFYSGWYARRDADGDGEPEADIAGEDEEAGGDDADDERDVEDSGSGQGDDNDAGQDDDSDDLGPAAERELARVRAHAGVLLDIVLRIVDRREGRHRAVSLLSAWEGFGRFTRESCGVEAATLLRAWRLVPEDPTAEVRRLYPKARADEAAAANWHAALSGPWAKHVAEL
jgi:hypothetical protein